MVANVRKWHIKCGNLAKKIEALPPTTPANEVAYMTLRLAKYRAYGLAWNFVFQTTERVGTAHKLAPWRQARGHLIFLRRG